MEVTSRELELVREQQDSRDQELTEIRTKLEVCRPTILYSTVPKLHCKYIYIKNIFKYVIYTFNYFLGCLKCFRGF
jgi:hypothetical protein